MSTTLQPDFGSAVIKRAAMDVQTTTGARNPKMGASSRAEEYRKRCFFRRLGTQCTAKNNVDERPKKKISEEHGTGSTEKPPYSEEFGTNISSF